MPACHATRRPTATGVLELPAGRRVFVFDPVVSADSTGVVAVIVGEMEPTAILRAALSLRQEELLSAGVYALLGPNGVPITSVPLPPGWPAIQQPVRVADTTWQLRWAYEPVNERGFAATRVAIWITGIAIGLALAAFLFFLQRSIKRQRSADRAAGVGGAGRAGAGVAAGAAGRGAAAGGVGGAGAGGGGAGAGDAALGGAEGGAAALDVAGPGGRGGALPGGGGRAGGGGRGLALHLRRGGGDAGGPQAAGAARRRPPDDRACAATTSGRCARRRRCCRGWPRRWRRASRTSGAEGAGGATPARAERALPRSPCRCWSAATWWAWPPGRCCARE